MGWLNDIVRRAKPRSDFVGRTKAIVMKRTYLGEGENAPEGSEEQEGPRGGRYYEAPATEEQKPVSTHRKPKGEYDEKPTGAITEQDIPGGGSLEGKLREVQDSLSEAVRGASKFKDVLDVAIIQAAMKKLGDDPAGASNLMNEAAKKFSIYARMHQDDYPEASHMATFAANSLADAAEAVDAHLAEGAEADTGRGPTEMEQYKSTQSAEERAKFINGWEDNELVEAYEEVKGEFRQRASGRGVQLLHELDQEYQRRGYEPRAIAAGG